MKIKIRKPFVHSTNEKWTGKYWVDGKKIYTKTIDLGVFPNATQKDVPLNITNLQRVLWHETFAFSGTLTLSLPFVSVSSVPEGMSFYFIDGNARIITGSNRSGFTGSCIIYYTKITD